MNNEKMDDIYKSSGSIKVGGFNEPSMHDKKEEDPTV
jgi:hypothetical protein